MLNVVSHTALLTGSAPYGYQNRANTYAVEGQSCTALNTNVYVQFSLSADSGYQLAVTNLDLYVARSSTGARSFALRSNLDDFSANLVEWTVADDSSTTNRPPIVLAGHSPGFGAADAMKAVVYFNSRSWWRKTGVEGELLPLDGSNGFLQCIRELEIQTGSGNPQAAALFMGLGR
jgi:hypothetical protein